MMGLFMWLLALPFRWFLGMPMVGGPVTDATFTSDGYGWAPGHKPGWLGPSRPLRWDLMAGWKRSAWRNVPITVFVAGVWCWMHAPIPTAAVIGAVGGLAGTLTLRWWRARHHVRTYVEPLHKALAPQLGFGPEVKARHWIELPQNFRDEDAEIKLCLPLDFYAGTDELGRGGRSHRGAIDGYVYEKLGLSSSEIRASYAMAGEAPSVTYTHMPRVPAKVSKDDVWPLILKAKESAPVIGLARGRKPVSIDLDSESPHVAVSIGTGGGKSMLTRSAIIHVLRHGGIVVVLDVKRTSHRWLKGHPRVLYVRDPADIAETIMRLRLDLDRRQIVTDEDEDAWPGPRVLVVVEERNTMVGSLKSWWAKVRTNEDPKTCPALTALNELAFMGREPMMHLWSIAQSATAATMGGPEGRENYSCRILGRYTANNWAMLVGRAFAMPKATRHRGRVQVVMDEVVECQTTLWETHEAKEAAWSCFPEGLKTPLEAPSLEEFFGEIITGDADLAGVVRGEVVAASDEVFETADVVEGIVVEPLAIEAGPAPVSPVPGVPTMPSHLGKQGGTVPEASPLNAESVTTAKRESAVAAHAETAENVVPFERPVTLTEALQNGVFTGFSPDPKKAREALKQARRRALKNGEWVRPVGKRGHADLYRPSDLARWERNRPQAKAEETA